MLGVVHDLWEPIPKEFDDYISRPKGNNYQSLHTAVIGPGGAHAGSADPHRGDAPPGGVRRRGALALQGKRKSVEERKARSTARSPGCASCSPGATRSPDGAGWAEKTKKASLDDTIYVLTPQGKVIDLPAGATPVDFAYTLHTDLGHRCRGAQVDGHMVPLDTPLASGQRVEIVAAKSGRARHATGCNPSSASSRATARAARCASGSTRSQLDETIAQGRAIVEKEQRREGAMQANLEQLAQKLGFAKPDELFAAVARDEVNLRQLQAALRELAGLVSVPQDGNSTGQENEGKVSAATAACSSSAWTG